MITRSGAARFLVKLLPVSVLLLSPLASAQRADRPLGGESPTLGIHLPTPSLVGGTDASGVEVNPAALGMLDSWSVMLHHAELRGEGRTPGTGTALFAARQLPILKSLSLGVGAQWLRPAEAIGYADYVKLSFATSWRPSQFFALGLVWHTFMSDGDGELADLDTIDLGLVLRPFEWLAAGFVVRDLLTPAYADLPVQRVYDLELAFRPFATRQLEVGLGASFGERRVEVDPHLRIEGEPLPGVRLFGGLQVLRRDFYRIGEDTTDYRFSIGFGFELERVGLALSTVAARSFGSGPGPLAAEPTRSAYQGLEATLHIHGYRRPPMVEVKKKILLIKLEGQLEERQVIELVGNLRRTEDREDLAGVLLDLSGLEAGLARIQEMRGWVRRLRDSGKKVYAFLRSGSQREYYLAAACDRVLLDPAGHLDLKGLALRTLYFRGAFDLLGLSPEFVRIAEFKSAPESYTHKGPSPEALQVARAFLDDVYGQMTRDLARDRRRTPAEIRALIDRGPFVPPTALAAGLVDELVESGEMKARVEKAIGGSLVRAEGLRRTPERWPVGPGIAVVVVDGDIVSGKSVDIPLLGRRVEGDETITRALAWARGDSSVKAVVLRVNSPGGSAWASDKMFRELMRLRRTKPIVVSMGDLAASGGYYIAAAGHHILAQPGTLTGSIGIFSGKFDISGLLRKVGINLETLAVEGKHALLDAWDRPYTPDERKLILSRLQYSYRQFLGAVSTGRQMTQDAVHAVARGRVWTGAQAVSRGLVDAQGGLLEALEEAKRRAGLPLGRPVRIFVLPDESPGLLGRLFKLVSRQGVETPLPVAVKEALRGVMPVLLRARPNEPLARLPYEILF